MAEYLDDARRFKLIQLLGQGGFGKVYTCLDNQDLQMKAAKVQKNEGALNDELELFRTLPNTPFLPTLVADDLNAKNGYIVMSLEGKDLVKVWREAPDHKLPVEQIISLGYNIMNSLKQLHQNGVIHRDIKLNNLALSRSPGKNPVVLLDLGMSLRPLQPDGTKDYTMGPGYHFSKHSFSSVRIINGCSPNEMDDVHAVAYTLLVLRNITFFVQDEAKELERKTYLNENLEQVLEESDSPLLEKPLRAMLCQPTEQLPMFNRILGIFQSLPGFDANLCRGL